MRDYLPKEVAEDLVGPHVKMMEMVWARLDKEYGNQLTIADDICHLIKKQFIPNLHGMLKNVEAILEACSKTDQVLSDH